MNCPKCGIETNDQYFDSKRSVMSNWLCKRCFEIKKRREIKIEGQKIRDNDNFKS